MSVRLILRNKEYEVKPGMTLRDSILKAGLNPASVLATRDEELITEEVILQDGEVIRLMAVISGGAA